MDDDSDSVNVKTASSSSPDNSASTPGWSDSSDRTELVDQMTTYFMKSLKISKRTKAVLEDAEATKKSKLKTKCLKASARPEAAVELDRLQEDSSDLPKNDKFLSAKDQTTTVG